MARGLWPGLEKSKDKDKAKGKHQGSETGKEKDGEAPNGDAGATSSSDGCAAGQMCILQNT